MNGMFVCIVARLVDVSFSRRFFLTSSNGLFLAFRGRLVCMLGSALFGPGIFLLLDFVILLSVVGFPGLLSVSLLVRLTLET